MQGAALAPHHHRSVPPADDVVRVLRHDGTLDRDADAGARIVGDDAVASIYEAMVRVRALDERLVMLQRQGRIGSHVGWQGEEAAILGSAAALRAQDWIFLGDRELGAALWRGMPLTAYVNQMFGNAADPMKGRQMPDHYGAGARAAKLTPIGSRTGTHITQAAGFAWAAKTKNEDVATLVYFDEGATSSGELHNGANFAGVFGAPLVLFCRNSSLTAGRSFAAKGIAYGIPGVRCDGNDLLAVLKVTRDAIQRASRGEGPTLIEALTERMPMPREGVREISDASTRTDPLVRVRLHLESRGRWSEAMQRDHESATQVEIDAAIDAAEKLGSPALETMFDDVYGAPLSHMDDQRAELLAAPRAHGFARP